MVHWCAHVCMCTCQYVTVCSTGIVWFSITCNFAYTILSQRLAWLYYFGPSIRRYQGLCPLLALLPQILFMLISPSGNQTNCDALLAAWLLSIAHLLGGLVWDSSTLLSFLPNHRTQHGTCACDLQYGRWCTSASPRSCTLFLLLPTETVHLRILQMREGQGAEIDLPNIYIYGLHNIRFLLFHPVLWDQQSSPWDMGSDLV